MKAVYAWVCKLEAIVAGTFLVLMVILIFLGGVARMLHYPLNWTGDVATFLFAWACFLCADVAWRNNSLMALDIVLNRVPVVWRRLLITINYVLISGFLVFIAVAGTYLSYIGRARSFQGIPWVSYSVVTLSLPVGAVLLLLTTLLKLRGLYRVAEVGEAAVEDKVPERASC